MSRQALLPQEQPEWLQLGYGHPIPTQYLTRTVTYKRTTLTRAIERPSTSINVME